ncbi:MAG: amidohydrolase family protein, partial [Desulfobulbaceae bacterium]|nr:amidohydrolase family protein [Desulfobulbaceae bacterium]
MIDGTGGPVQRKVLLTVKNGLIAAIGSVNDLPANANAADLSHCTIVPALVDCIVSLTRSPSVDNQAVTPTDNTILLNRHIRDTHSHGLLGVANCDDPAGVVQKYLKENKSAIIDIRNSGHDFLKIFYTGSIDAEASPAKPTRPAKLRSILEKRGNRKTIIVANGEQQVTDALAAGCDAIEQGYGMGEDNLERMAKQNLLWIPNVLRAKNGLDGSTADGSVCCRFSQRYIAPGKPNPDAEAFWKKTLNSQLALLRYARELGVKTALGTGAGSLGILHGESMVEEMKLFMAAGYSLEDTIYAASANGAEFFDMNNIGSLTVGKHATFLIARGSVKQLPRKLAYLEGI